MYYDYVGIIVAVLIAAGGAVGYFKAGSVPSLIAGLVFGILIGVGAYFNCQSPPKPLLQLCVLLILAILMFYRFFKSGNFMPAGLIATISAAAFIINIIIYFQDLKNQF